MAKVDDGKEKLFLMDTGATMTSANLNYFATPPTTLKTIASKAVGAAGTGIDTRILDQAVFGFCSIKFNSKLFPVRPEDRNWEWNENGKIGMDLLSSSLVMLDFGSGMALVK